MSPNQWIAVRIQVDRRLRLARFLCQRPTEAIRLGPGFDDVRLVR